MRMGQVPILGAPRIQRRGVLCPHPTQSSTRRIRAKGFVDMHATGCFISRSFIESLNFDMLFDMLAPSNSKKDLVEPNC